MTLEIFTTDKTNQRIQISRNDLDSYIYYHNQRKTQKAKQKLQQSKKLSQDIVQSFYQVRFWLVGTDYNTTLGLQCAVLGGGNPI